MNRVVPLLLVAGAAMSGVVACGDDDAASTATTVSSETTAASTTASPTTALASTTSPATTSTATPTSTSTTAPVTTTTVPETVTTAPVLLPEPVTIPAGQITVGAEDLVIVHDDGDLWLHPGLLGANPAAPVRLVDLDDPRNPDPEGPGPNQVEHVAGVFDGTVLYSDCCEPAAGNVLAATDPDSDRNLVAHGYTPKLNPENDRLVAVNNFALSVIELREQIMTSRPLNEGTEFGNVWDVSWADGGASLVVLSWDDAGYGLTPFDGTSLIQSGEPVLLDVQIDFEEYQYVLFAGHGPDGEVAVTVGDEASTVIRFFGGATLDELPDRVRTLPPLAESVRLGTDGVSLLWVVGEELWYHPNGGEPRTLGSGYRAAWFAT